jgi:predicted ATPase
MKKAKSEAEDIVNKLEKDLRNVYYVPAIRGIEKHFYNLADQYVIDLPAGRNVQLATTFAYASSGIKDMIEIWSNEITGSAISANLIPNKRVVIESSEADGIPVVVDGSGVNQLTQLLLMFGIVPSGSTLGIEEPEIHLHPKAQKKLCSLLAQLIKNVWKRQLIITTHSEHILYGFLSEMRNGNINREDLKIYYFEEKGSEPIYNEIDEGGDIYNWGKNFFNHS